MSRFDKLVLKLLRGASDAGFAFDDLRYILEKLGFTNGFAEAITSTIVMMSRNWSTSSGTEKTRRHIRYVTFAT